MVDRIARKMMELGFTLYEARAYICLLQHYPATRYEISKRSGVPRSAIYDVINRLEKCGAVSAISREPKKYNPLPPDKFIALLGNHYKNRIRDFYDSISDIRINMETENLWNITGYQNLILKAKEMIHNARKMVYLSAWKREALELEQELREALNRGVKVVLFSFTSIPEVGLVYSYGLSEKELRKVWDHKIILVRDMEELVMGEANKQFPRQVAWTYNKAIVMIAANHIVLDITLYGQRLDIDIRDAVIETHPGELELLGRLLQEKYPDNPKLSLNFTTHAIKESMDSGKR